MSATYKPSSSWNNYITLLKLQNKRQPIQMIGYKDKTWCVHSLTCSNVTCYRNLNEEEIKQATEWWGGVDFPYLIGNFKTDDCGWKPSLKEEQTNLEEI